MAKRKQSAYQRKYAHMRKMGYSVERARRGAKTDPCYIATAVYGSYDCPQVWTLRRYRDEYLKQNLYGRVFIKCYYALSPTFVKLFGKTKWFNRLFKARLDKMVNRLNNEGFSDKPYTDKE